MQAGTRGLHTSTHEEGSKALPGGSGMRLKRTWKHLKGMDGKSPTFSMAVLVAATLSMLTLVNERGFLEGRDDSFLMPKTFNLSPAMAEIVECILLLVFCALVGVLSFMLLHANLEYVSRTKQSYRKESYTIFGAFITMILADVLAVFNMIGAEKAFQWRKITKSFICPISHYYLVLLFALSMLAMNFLFLFVIVADFLRNQHQKKKAGRWELSEKLLVKTKTGAEKSADLAMGWKIAHVLEVVYYAGVAAFVRTASSCASLVDSSMKYAASRTRVVKDVCTKMKSSIRDWTETLGEYKVTQMISKRSAPQFTFFGIRDKISALGARARAAECPDSPKSLLALKGFLRKMDRISTKLKSLKPSLVNKSRELWDDLKQDEEYKHSAWLKSAVMTAFILIIYFGVRISTGFRHFMFTEYVPFRECLRINQGYIQYILSKMKLGTYQMYDAYKYPKACSVADVKTPFSESGILLPHLANGVVINVIRAFDIIIMRMNYTVYVGLFAGLLSALYSLVSVLAQYKRISLAVRAGYFDALLVDPDRQVVGRRKERYLQIGADAFETKEWSEVVETYPMSSSMFFFAILVSTAVVQLMVFGFSVATGLAAILGFVELYSLGKQCMAFLLACGLTWLFNDVIVQWIFGEGMLQNKYEVYRERGFVFYLLVYGMVHMILGILLTFSRLIMLVLSSLLSLSRLDRNLYTYNKGLDQGHRSFVATVLLHTAFDASVLSTTEDSCGSDPGESENIEAGASHTIVSGILESNSNKNARRDDDHDSFCSCETIVGPESESGSELKQASDTCEMPEIVSNV